MAVIPAATEFPRILTLLTCAGGLFVGLFVFIFSCVLNSPANIMLAMVIIGSSIILLLTAIHILSEFQSNIPMTTLLVLFCIISSFIVFVNYCLYARATSFFGGAYFAVSIVVIILLLALMVVYAIFIVVLVKHHEQKIVTAGTTSTTVTSSRTVTTNIETPPANYVIQTAS